MSDIRNRILTFLDDELGMDLDEVQPDTLLFSSGMIDSFSLVTLMTFLEENFGFRISPDDVTLDNLDSVERIEGFIGKSTE
ncbi:MAG: acyl carrier protein [Magnetococcales bacterium]|nr:acyl carrier protein [Magnetococcales bacterium]